MHRLASLALMTVAAAFAGCSSGSSGLSTGSIFGNAPTPPPAAGAAPAVAVVAPAPSSPTDRAFQVGSVSARAVKCGYNFDAAQLKASYLAHEIGVGAGSADMGRIEKIYDVAYGGVMKAASDEANYCSDKKTQEIKADLNRLLAGDFEPPRRQVAAKKDDDGGGLFGGFFSGSSQESGPSWGSNDWWDKQRDKVSN